MPSKTITVTNGDGSTRTITIPDRSRFAGVRNISRKGKPLDDTTTQIQVTVAGHANISGIYTKGIPSEFDWAQQGGTGRIYREQVSQYNYEWKLLDISDGAPSTLFGSGLVSETDSRPWKAANTGIVTIEPAPETLTVNRTAPVITSDRKGASRPLLSKVVGGAAAAYSLRDLNDKAGNNKVVRVRRASDNHERDFLAKEVSNGTLKNWVNTQTVLPLDIQALTDDGRTGAVIPAKAAYSLRNLSKNYTGNVVDVRRFTDGATNSYTADEITGGTLTSFANESVKYMDSTGATDSRGWIVTNGLTYQVVGSTDYLANNLSFSTTGGFNNTEKYAFTGLGDSGSFGSNWYLNNSFNVTRIGTSASTKTVTIEAYVKRTSGSSSDNLYFRPYAQQTSNKFTVTGLVQDEWTLVKGTLIKDSAVDAKTHVQIGGDTGVTFEISNVKFYSENNDVTVSKWYDQSGNDNHAVQATPAEQPKIVESGQVKDHLLFDGTNSYLALTTPLDFDDGSGFFTVKGDASDPSQTLMGGHSGTNYLPLLQNNNTGNQYTNNITVSSEFVNGNQQTWADRDDAFDSVITNNYVLASFIDINNASGALLKDIGRGAGATTWVFKGEMKEVILYDTDQTDNRTAIEANIGEAYSITGIPAYDNTVDGFVETWYDQSGENFHMLQAESTKQPKIVENGNFLGSVKYDGSTSYLKAASMFNITNQAVSLFSVQTRVGANDATLGATNSGRGISFENSVTRVFITQNLHIVNHSPDGSGFLLGTVIHTGDGSSDQIKTARNGVNIEEASQGTNDVISDGQPIFTTQYNVIGGNRVESTNSNFFNGEIKEVVIWKTNQLANRPAIEANINNQYDIY